MSAFVLEASAPLFYLIFSTNLGVSCHYQSHVSNGEMGIRSHTQVQRRLSPDSDLGNVTPEFLP